MEVTKFIFIFVEIKPNTMQDNTDNPAYPIIEFLNERINKDKENKQYWEENYQKSNLWDIYRSISINRIAAFEEVLQFIEETFKPE